VLLRRGSDVAPYTSASTAAAYNALQENEHLPLDDFVLRLRKWAQVRRTAVRPATGQWVKQCVARHLRSQSRPSCCNPYATSGMLQNSES